MYSLYYRRKSTCLLQIYSNWYYFLLISGGTKVSSITIELCNRTTFAGRTIQILHFFFFFFFFFFVSLFDRDRTTLLTTDNTPLN